MRWSAKTAAAPMRVAVLEAFVQFDLLLPLLLLLIRRLMLVMLVLLIVKMMLLVALLLMMMIALSLLLPSLLLNLGHHACVSRSLQVDVLVG